VSLICGVVKTGDVRVLFVSVSVAVIRETVPVRSGSVIVLSLEVVLVNARVVSKSSALEPSDIIDDAPNVIVDVGVLLSPKIV